MKSKLVNQNVIRAISIGLSAVMAASPMTAMAAEGSVEPVEPVDPVAEGEQKSTTLADQVTDVVEMAENAENTAADVAVSESAAVDAADATENATIMDAADDLEDVTLADKNDEKNDVVELTGDVTDELNTAAEGAGNQQDAIDEAEKQVEESEAIVENVENTLDAASDAIAENTTNIENAATIEEAADELDKAQETYDDAEKAYNDAAAALDDAKTAYDNAIKAAEDAKKAYDDAIENAEDNADSAVQELADAAAKAKALADAAQAELENAKLEAAQEAALAIIAQQEVANQKANNWNECDKLFSLIMENYYQGKMELKENQTITFDDKFTKFPDDSKNYLKAVITTTNEDGTTSEETRYFNYKLDKETKKKLIIFEKTWEEYVAVEAEDAAYVVYDENSAIARSMTPAELAQKLNSHEVVEKEEDGKTVYYAMAVTEDGEVADAVYSESKELADNQAVKENSESVTWAVDEDGKIVKTTTGTVTTTTTREDVSLKGGKGYASEAAAKAAAETEAKKNALDGEKVTNTDIIITTNADATASITYITTFTTTIDLKGMQTSWKKDSKSAIKEIKDDVSYAFDDSNPFHTDVEEKLDDAGYNMLSWKYVENIQVKETDKHVGGYEDYKVTAGKVSVTYAKVSTITVDQWLLEALFKGTDKQEAMVKAGISAGSELINYDVFDGKLGKGTGTYYAANTVTVNKKATGDNALSDAKTAALDEVLKKAQSDADKQINKDLAKELQKIVNGKSTNVSTVANLVTSTKGGAAKADITKSSKTYAYGGTFDTEKKTEEENVVLSVEKWNADKLTYKEAVEEEKASRLTNGNYLKYINEGDASGILLFEESDEEFNKYLEDAKAAKAELERKQAAYTTAKEKAEQAKADADSAKAEVKKLQEAIKALAGKANRETEVAALGARLAAALGRYENALEKLNELESALEEAGAAYAATVARLTPAPIPAPTPGGGIEDAIPGGGTGTGAGGGAGTATTAAPAVATVATTTVAPAPAAAPAVALAAGNVAVNAGGLAGGAAVADEAVADAQEELTTIVDEQTPLNASIDEEDKELTTIADEETPLDASLDEKQQMSWWWLLIIAVLGATGAEMYRRHKKKLALAEEAKVEEE